MNPNYDFEVQIYCCMYQVCGTEFNSRYNLKRHVEAVHLNHKKFKCFECSQLFSSKQSLKEHYYKHLGSLPFKCLTCDKSFRQSSLLSLHKRVHKSEGTASVWRSEEASEMKFPFHKIMIERKETPISLPSIEDNRKGVQILPFPEF